jgi:formylmethanofuran dehydrogenase subunit E
MVREQIMIELTCNSCGNTFERRGAKRGGKPDCNECRLTKELERRRYVGVAMPGKVEKVGV